MHGEADREAHLFDRVRATARARVGARVRDGVRLRARVRARVRDTVRVRIARPTRKYSASPQPTPPPRGNQKVRVSAE